MLNMETNLPLIKSIPRAASVRKPQTDLFYKQIREDFTKMANVKKNGVRVASIEYIIATLATRYFRSTKTIEKIIYNRV